MKKIDIHMHVPPNDPTMENYLQIMDRHDVYAVLVHAMPWVGHDNAETLHAVKAHPDRLFGSVMVDLRMPVDESIELVRRYAGEGFRSIKLFPNLGFNPGDEHLEPFWAVVEELGLFCLSHCGWLTDKNNFAGKRIQSLTSSPFHFEMPARRFPKIKFILAHFGGFSDYMQTIVLTTRMANVYADGCPGQGEMVFAHRMPGIEAVDFSKVLYGTDGAGDQYSEQESWWREVILDIGKTEEDCRKYFYNNAAQMLGLPLLDA
jgi:predicted TIM-barrel fold metal-dependent hydrolase